MALSNSNIYLPLHIRVLECKFLIDLKLTDWQWWWWGWWANLQILKIKCLLWANSECLYKRIVYQSENGNYSRSLIRGKIRSVGLEDWRTYPGGGRWLFTFTIILTERTNKPDLDGEKLFSIRGKIHLNMFTKQKLILDKYFVRETKITNKFLGASNTH